MENQYGPPQASHPGSPRRLAEVGRSESEPILVTVRGDAVRRFALRVRPQRSFADGDVVVAVPVRTDLGKRPGGCLEGRPGEFIRGRHVRAKVCRRGWHAGVTRYHRRMREPEKPDWYNPRDFLSDPLDPFPPPRSGVTGIVGVLFLYWIISRMLMIKLWSDGQCQQRRRQQHRNSGRPNLGILHAVGCLTSSTNTACFYI